MRRRLIILTLCLLVGAVINVLVAWGIALWAPVRFSVKQDDAISRALLKQYLGAESVELVYELPYLVAWKGHGMTMTLVHFPKELVWLSMIVCESGWPARGLVWVKEHDEEAMRLMPAAGLRGGLSPPQFIPQRPKGSSRYTSRRLPVAPLWGGFAINTLLYTVLIWLITLAPFTARRIYRRRHGLCVKCGYAMEGLATCPECGLRGSSERPQGGPSGSDQNASRSVARLHTWRG